MEVCRLHRVLKLVTALQSSRVRSAKELAAEVGVSRRTIYRDLNLIEKAGIPFHFDREAGGYQMNAAALLPAINLTLEEALSIILMASELGQPGRIPLVQPARDAAAKIESSLPVGLRASLGAVMRNMAMRTAPTARHNALQAMYGLVQRAIVRRESLDAVYISFHDKGQIRTRIDPYWLFFNERAWYVIGRSSRHNGIRTFKLGRFKRLERAGRRFEAPRRVTLEKHLGNAWRMMRGDRSFDVQLRFSPLVGPTVAEVNWHRTQKIRWEEDGAVVFTATVDGLDEIVWWVLGYGPEVEVLTPPELRTRIHDMARRMAALYEGA